MKRAGFPCIVVLLAVGALASCSSDESTGNSAAAGNAGKPSGGSSSAGSAGKGQAGSTPSTAGSAGSTSGPGGIGGNQTSGGNGGSAGDEAVAGAGASQGGDSGQAGAGAEAGAGGGAGAGACGDDVESVEHSCASVNGGWTPQFRAGPKELVLDVGAQSFTVVSGTVNYYYSDGNAHGCGFANFTVDGTELTAVLPIDVTPTLVGVSLFSLTDECGVRHDFEPGTANSCNALQWSSATSTWACTPRPDACVDQC